MFDWSKYWNYGYGHLRSLVSEILDGDTHTRALSNRQTARAITTAAAVEDGERPKEKPRPPAGGHTTPLPSQD